MKSSNITSSEWEIMKVLWENDFLTAGAIIKEVNKEMNWAKTTINSFIQRLLNKEYINFKHDKRYREYYALYTERECVIERMQDVTKSIYGSKLNLATKYFEFFGDNDIEFLNSLKKYADSGYERITSILKYVTNEKQSVHLYKTQKRFHSVMGNQNAASWYRAAYSFGMLHMSPLKHYTDISADKALMHVFTQSVISHINENCPYYLHQGISAYLAQWLDKKRINEGLTEKTENINLHSLREFVFDLQNFRSSAGYEISYTFIDFIVTKFGIHSLRKMIDDPYDIAKLFNIDEEILLSEFKEHIHKNFL